MPSTDINGQPVLILSREEAVVVGQLLDYQNSMFEDEVPLGEKVNRFLKETEPDAQTS